MSVKVWRQGKTTNRTLKLKVFKAYSMTAPFDCPKSQLIFERGCDATGAWIKEYGWYYDLARRWDGTYVNQGQTIAGHDKFKQWDSTGAMLLAYAQQHRRLYLTGKIDRR